MIRVNGLSTVNFISRPAFRAVEASIENNIQENKESASLNGMQALASYNFNIIDKIGKLDEIKPLDLIFNPDGNVEIEGEKIYTSEGKLKTIVKDNGETKTVYIPSEENENLIDTIKVVDKKSNKVLKEQSNYIEDGKYDGAWIGEYSLNDGKLTHSTIYDKDGNVEKATAYKTTPKGRRASLTHDFADKEYRVSAYGEKTKQDIFMRLDNNKKPVEFSEYQDINSIKRTSLNVDFYQGNMLSIYKSETITVPNAFGREKFENPELLPAEKYIPNIDLKGQEGEKSYYSNGAIEKNVIGDTIAYFDVDGNLEKVKAGRKEITIDGKNQYIVEDLGEGKTKTSELYEDGDGYVEVKTQNDYKEIYFDKNKRPCNYSEGIIEENGEKDNKLSLDFNDNGMLTDAHSW